MTTQPATTPPTVIFPGVGHVYKADYGAMAFDLTFHSDKEMTYTGSGKAQGQTERVAITITPLRPWQFAITWYETNGTVVVDIEDFAQEKVSTVFRTAAGQFTSIKGTLKRVS